MSLTAAERQEYVNDNFLAAIEELVELKRCFPFLKFWHDPEPCDADAVKVMHTEGIEEFADVMHHLANIALALGFTAKEIEQAYQNKVLKNYVRQGKTPSVILPQVRCGKPACGCGE